MPETKKCKHCQSEIDKKAKVCPVCKRKQGGKLKFIILAFVVIVIIGAIATQGNDDSDDNNGGTVQTANTDTTNKQSGTDSEEDKAIAFGSEGQSGDLALKVNEVGDVKEITENEFISYKPDSGKYAVVNITIKNTGKEAKSLTNGYFKLVTADEAEYNPTILIGLDNKYISFESINPGLDVTGNLVFEVPTDLVVTDAVLRFSGTSLFTASTDFNLK